MNRITPPDDLISLGVSRLVRLLRRRTRRLKKMKKHNVPQKLIDREKKMANAARIALHCALCNELSDLEDMIKEIYND